MRIRVFGYRHCPSVHRIMHHATRIPDEMEPDVVFIDVAKHSVTLRDMADRAGCPVDNFPCVFVDDVYLSLYIDLCNCLILICSIQHQMKVNLWTKNSYRLWLTNWPKTSK
ncbi:hypothetical protein JRC16_21040, partial [Escherichia coli]|nr:hypothetical protein [Escherichia coli]